MTLRFLHKFCLFSLIVDIRSFKFIQQCDTVSFQTISRSFLQKLIHDFFKTMFHKMIIKQKLSKRLYKSSNENPPEYRSYSKS